jgi:hypothetical protein
VGFTILVCLDFGFVLGAWQIASRPVLTDPLHFYSKNL